MKRWSNRKHGSVPDKPDMAINEGVVADKILRAYRLASERLTSLGIQHAVVGGLAVGAWGHPRATRDVDFLVRAKDAFDGSVFLTFKAGVPIEVDGVAIDYLTVESLPIVGRETIENRDVVPLELLFAMKLIAKRRQDDADIIALIQRGADTHAINRWLLEHKLCVEHKRLGMLLDAAENE